MSIVVQKYGGTSVATSDKIKAIAQRIKATVKKGNSCVIVVSAMGKTTDHLVSLASEITDDPSDREMDMLLSTGEQITISLLAMALHEIEVSAVSMTGLQAKVLTDSNHTRAKIESIASESITKALNSNDVVIVAGFQGTDVRGNITTLGRGGSDTSAVALAAATGADVCEIFTDVDGIYTSDPRIVNKPKKLNEISYDEMLELARLGAGVLHSRSVEFARKYNVVLHVRSSFNDINGTFVKAKEDIMEKFVISGVTSKNDEAKMTLHGIPDEPGIAAQIFKALSEAKIYINMIVQSTGLDGKATISFTVLKNDLAKAMDITNSLSKKMDSVSTTFNKDIAIVSVVGTGMLSSYGVASEIFEALAQEGINIEMISTSEIGISCVIDSSYEKDAVKLIHKLFLENK
jgi:aspartate kinase